MAYAPQQASEFELGSWDDWFNWAISRYNGSFAGWLCDVHDYTKKFFVWLKHFVPPGATVLEAGCGMGSSAILLSALGYDVTAIDIDEGTLHRARELCQILAPKVKLQKADIFDFTATQKFDLVTSLGVVEHFADEVTIDFAKAMLEVLARLGKSVLVWVPATQPKGPTPPVHVYSEHELTRSFKAAGLDVISSYRWGQSLAMIGKQKVTMRERLRGIAIPHLI